MDATDEMFDPLRRAFHLDRYRFAARYSHGCRVADIACGTGYGAELIKLTGWAEQVWGVDISVEAIQYAESHHCPDGTNFVCAAAEDTGLEAESLDLVVSFETIEHVSDDGKLLEEFHRVLRPGGHLICSTPNDWPLDSSPHHLRTYNRESFEDALTDRFTLAELFNQNSGSPSEFNHEQPAGIVKTTKANEGLAECYIAICVKDPQRG